MQQINHGRKRSPWSACQVIGRMPDFRDVDPRELRVPPSRRQGADPDKLAR
jgi:hypothetical protein